MTIKTRTKRIPEPELDQSINQILNQYHQDFTKDCAKSWLLEYCDKNHPDKKTIVSRVGKSNIISTYGFLARAIERGLEIEGMTHRIDDYIISLESLILSEDDDKENDSDPEESSVTAPRPRNTFDINPFLEHIDHLIDGYILNGTEFDINQELKTHPMPGYALAQVKKEISQYNYDPTIEGYEFLGIRRCNKLNEMLTIKKVTRTVRKRKIDPYKQIVRLNYLESHEGLVESIHPVHIVSAKVLVTLDIKKKTFCLYKSLDVSGLGVKGTSIQNHNTKFKPKKVKNPLIFIEVLKTKETVAEIIEAFIELEGKESGDLKALINKNTLLLKVK